MMHKFIGQLDEYDVYVAELRDNVIYVRFGSAPGDYKSCFPKEYNEEDKLLKEIYEFYKKRYKK